jgi:hypothetical protein
MKRDHEMKRRARELRQNSNPLEEIVWTHLRDRRLGGFKFRCQHVVHSFVADQLVQITAPLNLVPTPSSMSSALSSMSLVLSLVSSVSLALSSVSSALSSV